MSCGNCCDSSCCDKLPTGPDACEALNQYNDENIKPLRCLLEKVNKCDGFFPFLGRAFDLFYCLFSNIINNICLIWDVILDNDGYVTVTKVYKYTVPVDKFVSTGNTTTPIWWSGSVEKNESYITIPVEQMDLVDAVVAQPQVVGGRVHPVTVAIQSAVKTGNNYIVNFDTYEIKGSFADEEFPFAVPIVFVVTGRKKINSNWKN